jgi:RNA 3'-phosphate cyclase
LILVDGSLLEGGGQILRMAISYSAVLGVPVRIVNIRAGRTPPGLRPQHLTTLKAVKEICNGEADGLSAGSMEVKFRPGRPKGGSYSFDIGTAGSISLLLQCIAPIASFADSPAEMRIRGGTAVRWSPPIRILSSVVWEAFREMGFTGRLTVRREGFYPRGGGSVDVSVKPVVELGSLRAESVDRVPRVEGVSVCGRLPRHVAERQARSAERVLEEAGIDSEVSIAVAEGDNAPLSPGSVLSLWAISSPKVFIGASSLGERGKPAERVGEEAANSLVDELRVEATVDQHTADNLILWCSLAGGQSTFTTSTLTNHTKTAIEMARLFTGVEFTVGDESKGRKRISCEGIGLKNGWV